MKERLVLALIFLLLTPGAFCQKTEAEKALWKLKESKTLIRALKHPHKAKYVSILNCTDSVFPSDDLLKLVNIEHIVLYAPVLRKKITDSLAAPQKIRIDTIKVKQLPKLKYLIFSYFDFRNFPIELCYLRNLKGLNISACLVDSLPDEIENLINLQALVLRLNYVRQLPGSVRNLDSLTHLDLANNSLKNFPAVLCDMQNLKRVNLINLESREAVDTWSWAWPFSIDINRIDYFRQLGSLTDFLAHAKLEKLGLPIYSKESKAQIKKIIPKEFFRKTTWAIYPYD